MERKQVVPLVAAVAVGGVVALCTSVILCHYQRKKRDSHQAKVSGPLTLVLANKNYSSWSLRAWLFVKHAAIPVKEVRIPIFTPQWATEYAYTTDIILSVLFVYSIMHQY
jgi:hypothetical protein